VHAATDAAVARAGSAAPEVVSIAFAFALQWIIKNPLLSIFSGTALYVAWVNGYLPF
jgi:branched-subunit amino acid transport protein AzlD